MYVYIYIQGWKQADSHRQMQITFGVIANHFGQLIRNNFGSLHITFGRLRITFQMNSQKTCFLSSLLF